MASVLRELCRDEERMRSLITKCFETGLNYSWEKVASQYLECYERVFGADGRE